MFFCDSRKLIGYLVSAVIVASAKPCVDPSARTKIFLFLLSKCTKELLLPPKMIAFFHYFHLSKKPVNVNQILYHSHYVCIYLDQRS